MKNFKIGMIIGVAMFLVWKFLQWLLFVAPNTNEAGAGMLSGLVCILIAALAGGEIYCYLEDWDSSGTDIGVVIAFLVICILCVPKINLCGVNMENISGVNKVLAACFLEVCGYMMYACVRSVICLFKKGEEHSVVSQWHSCSIGFLVLCLCVALF